MENRRNLHNIPAFAPPAGEKSDGMKGKRESQRPPEGKKNKGINHFLSGRREREISIFEDEERAEGAYLGKEEERVIYSGLLLLSFKEKLPSGGRDKENTRLYRGGDSLAFSSFRKPKSRTRSRRPECPLEKWKGL